MADRKSIQACIDGAISALEKQVGLHGFSSAVAVKTPTNLVVQWTRELDWKKERVQADHPLHFPDGLNLQVLVDIPCRDGEDVIFDGRHVEVILNRNGEYRVPTLFTKLRCASFIRRVTEDTVKALSWFEKFRTPKQALQRLQEGKTHYGLAKGKAYEDLSLYLSRLQTVQETDG